MYTVSTYHWSLAAAAGWWMQRLACTCALHSVQGGQSRGGPASPSGQRTARMQLWSQVREALGERDFIPRYFLSHSSWNNCHSEGYLWPSQIWQTTSDVPPKRSPHRQLKIQSNTTAAGSMAGRCVALDWNWCVLPLIITSSMASVFPSV